ncbi:hypothetical protein Cfor_04829 [Coptotermes formosanus]|jgi:hypothetical protein|uniref:DNA-directed primase/polymerase protein n=1 Tax=Coptotermes formosanus TaxID=36987 RepID=A0A6L2Q8V9_COPFO|nr:hypothetical protein Cfor_04829 [Coptotermes formosanus]
MSDIRHQAYATLTPRTFYGKIKCGKSCDVQADEKQKCKNIRQEPKFQKWPRSLDPVATWKVFRKQQDALDYARIRKNGLMTFAFQDKFGCRMFLVAHPTVFWFYDTKRSCQDRCSYEIILEYAVCKLYFDLEFSRKYNHQHDGSRMVETFIKLVSFHLKREWGITANRHHVIDLDSSTENKFSRHLIFMLPNVIFQDNYNIGNFVKDMCNELRIYINQHSKQKEGRPQGSDFYSDIDKSHVFELLVVDNNGTKRLFCDESVYTKNRHFRVYMSTKLNKNAPLIVSKENQYRREKICGNNYSQDLQLFLDSLITYVPVDEHDLRVLKYGHCGSQELCVAHRPSRVPSEGLMSRSNVKSPYPEVDEFVTNIIYPGRIRQWLYFSSGNHIVYDIAGYRYCGNIGRQHRSNNIKYVVNLTNYTYYQKCYDPECAHYRSEQCKLPPELIFFLEDDSFLHTTQDNSKFSTTSGYFGMLEEDFVQLIEAVESSENDCHDILHLGDTPSIPSGFPDYGLSDHDASSVLDSIASSV